MRLILSMTIISLLILPMTGATLAKETGEIVHDAEYYILEAQNEKKWAAEDMG